MRVPKRCHEVFFMRSTYYVRRYEKARELLIVDLEFASFSFRVAVFAVSENDVESKNYRVTPQAFI